MPDNRFRPSYLDELADFLRRVPAVTGLGSKIEANGDRWIKFDIDIDHGLAWNVVQELGHLLNYLSLGERLTTVFKPVSPPPYLNGGPKDYLSWVIEADRSANPRSLKELLEGRMPRPVEDASAWATDPT
ncbi:MAG TPA: hypothetical protein VG889_04290 [Rhizomicrobium sp.]|nr:hypothetical protein [Rhizomicrobium sp.]